MTRIVWFLIGIVGGLRLQYYLTGISIQSAILHYRNIEGTGKLVEQKSLQELRNMYGILSNSYFDKDKVNLEQMREGGLKGFIAAIDDPYTEYLPPVENDTLTQELQGEEDFEGIGAAISKKEGAIQIQEVYKGTPAAIAGLQPLDYIVQIDGESTTDMSTTDAVNKIRGPKDTTVKLLIYRGSLKEETAKSFEVEVTRKAVQIPSVSSEVITLPGTTTKVGFVAIAVIGANTDRLLKTELDTLKEQDIKGLILDLRGNGGGYLPVGVDIASHFVPPTKLVVTAKYANAPDEEYFSRGYGEFDNTPIVVLMDGLTASAGEIIAGALKQDVDALLVGTTTFGKGSIQSLLDIGSGGALKFTIGKRYLPDGTNIDHEGLKPDVEVPFERVPYEKDMTDNQKQAAIRELAKLIK